MIALLPKDWLTALPGQLVVALHLVAEPRGKDPYRLASLFSQHETVGSVVDGGRAEVWTDFRVLPNTLNLDDKLSVRSKK